MQTKIAVGNKAEIRFMINDIRQKMNSQIKQRVRKRNCYIELNRHEQIPEEFLKSF